MNRREFLKSGALVGVVWATHFTRTTFAVAFCHIPLYNSGPNPNGGEAPREKGCASWFREAQELWGPILRTDP